MCTGAEAMLVASLASTAAGTAATINAGKQRRKASESAAYGELQRRQKLSDESQQLFQDELANSTATDASKDVDEAAAQQFAEAQALIDRDTGFTSATQTPGLAQSASPVVKDVAARSLADELQKAESMMKARSVLQGMGVRQQQRARQFGRTAERQQMINNFGQGWGQVGAVQQEMAKNAGSNMAMLGDVLTGLGQMGTAYAGATGGWQGLFGGSSAPSSQYALSGAQLGDAGSTYSLATPSVAEPNAYALPKAKLGATYTLR